MNILILNWRDIKHPLAGGAEISTHEHAKGWVRNGHRVTIFSSYFRNAQFREELDGVSVIRRGSHYTVHLYALLYYVTNARHTVDLVVDEFHFIPFFTPLYVRGKLLAFIHETAEEVWFKNTPWPISLAGFLVEPIFFTFYQNTRFMTVSKSTKDDVIKFGIKESRITIVPNGISTISTNEVKSKNLTVMYLGRISYDKGIADALDAFSYIYHELPEASFWIVGKEEAAEYVERLKRRVRERHMEQAVRFYGFVTEKRKYEMLRKARVLLHPSVKEGWGLTVIEAASQGTPTVAYKTAGLSDSIVDGKTGILVDERNPKRLGQAVLTLHADRLLYERMSNAAKKWSRKFNWEKSVAKSVSLIESLV